MRVAVIGGTGFIGRAIVAELEAAGHAVLVVHRGERESDSESGSGTPTSIATTSPAWWRRSTDSRPTP